MNLLLQVWLRGIQNTTLSVAAWAGRKACQLLSRVPFKGTGRPGTGGRCPKLTWRPVWSLSPIPNLGLVGEKCPVQGAGSQLLSVPTGLWICRNGGTSWEDVQDTPKL